MKKTVSTLISFIDSLPPGGDYKLSDVALDIPDSQTAIFRPTVYGPEGSYVWARAWLWNMFDNTLAENASSQLNAGDHVALTVVIKEGRIPDHASMRLESSPLHTEHVVTIALP